MLIEKDYCDYETCVALKELGFNEKCHGYYEPQKRCFNTTSIKHSWCNSEVDDIGVIICPTLYEAQKWLREEKQIEVNASFDKTNDGWIAFIQRLDYPDLCGTDVFSTVYNTYESALLVSIKEAVKILKEKNNENNL